MSRIELQHINKYYGSNHVLKDINLTIEDGDFMTLLGPSGCGKTTTLRIVSGLEKPQDGILLLDGRAIIDCDKAFYETPGKRGLNLVFQSYALWPHMTVYKNVAFGLQVQKMKRSEIDCAVMSSLEKMRISEYKDRYPSELSGGQQQRVAIARAIASKPQILLLDEPLSNLDAKLRVDMRSELKRLHEELGTTILYVTHDQVEAMTMSTRIALFSMGELVQVAPPLELYTNPATLTVADFIGNPRINFIDGKATYNGGKLSVVSSLGGHDFEDAVLREDIPESSFGCVVAVRPEQITLTGADTPGAIQGRVFANQPAGSETLIMVDCQGDRLLIKQIGIQMYKANQPVGLVIHPDKINIYHKATGKLIKRVV